MSISPNRSSYWRTAPPMDMARRFAPAQFMMIRDPTEKTTIGGCPGVCMGILSPKSMTNSSLVLEVRMVLA